jgi:putative membrane protein
VIYFIPANILMFLDIVAYAIAGIAVGTLTGLIPGIHPNTVFVLMVSAASLLAGLPPELALTFIMALVVSNTFTDFLPSLLLGAPDPSTAMSVLPGHRMLLEGRGYEAISLTVLGGLGVALLILLCMPVLLYAVPAVYTLLVPVMHIALFLVVAWMVLSERGMKRLFAAGIFLISGIFGLVALNAYPSGSLLFPALTGLFGLSTLAISYSQKGAIPRQDRGSSLTGDHRKGILVGWAAGWLSGMLPGVGAAQAGAVASRLFRARLREFLIALGGINTSNIFFTFIMFFTLGKTRSGAMWAISQFADILAASDVLLLSVVGITASFVSAGLTLLIAGILLKRLGGADCSRLSMGVMAFLLLAVLVLSGPVGLAAAATGTFTGLLAIRLGVKRSHLMGFLLLPTILYFSGLNPAVMVTLGF